MFPLLAKVVWRVSHKIYFHVCVREALQLLPQCQPPETVASLCLKVGVAPELSSYLVNLNRLCPHRNVGN